MLSKLFLFSTLLLSACQQAGQNAVMHNLPPSRKNPPSTLACNDASTQVSNALTGLDGVTVSTVTPAAGCMVSVQTVKAEDALTVMKTIKQKFLSYTTVVAKNKISVPVWISTKAPSAPPHAKDGKPISNVPAKYADCNAAITLAKQTHPNAVVTMQNSGAALAAQCYLNLAFDDDTTFESFFTATNPYSTNGDIFRMVVNQTTVVLRPYRTPKR